MATKLASTPSIEIVTEEVPLPPEFTSIVQSSQFIAIASKDYSTVANTWHFTTLLPGSASVVDIIREDFADGVSFQRIPLASDVAGFAQSSDGQSLLIIDKKSSAVIIRRNKETSRTIELLPDLRVILERNPQALSPSLGGFLAISNDARQCVFHSGVDDRIFYYIERSHRLPAWMTLSMDWSSALNAHNRLNVCGHVFACRFIQTDTGNIICSMAAAYYSRSAKTDQPTLVVSSFLVRPLLEQAHFLSRPQCSEVKQFRSIFSMRSLHSAMVPNYQRDALVGSISHSGNVMALVVNQNQAGLSLDHSRLLFLSLHVRALVICRLDNVLATQNDVVTDVTWLRSDLLCAVCTARGRFALFGSACGALRLVLTDLATPNDDLQMAGGKISIFQQQQRPQAINLLAMPPGSSAVLNKNKLAIHVAEPVFLCYSLAQAGHVLLRNVPPRIKVVRDFLSAASSSIKDGDWIEAGKLNLSAWGLVATSIDPLHDRQLGIIRQLSTQTFQICSSFIIGNYSDVSLDTFSAFVTELRSLLGFCLFNEDALSLLSETITLALLIAFDRLLPSASVAVINAANTTDQPNPTPETLMVLFRLVQSLDQEIRMCYKHLDTTSCDVKNIDESGVGSSCTSRSKPHDSFPALSWALSFYERLYLECCRQVAAAGQLDAEHQSVTIAAFKPLLQQLQASCALVCPISSCVAALADVKVAPGVDYYLDGKIDLALRTWSNLFAEMRAGSDSATEVTRRNIILTSLFGLLTADRIIEAVLLSDFVILNIVCPVRRKVDFATIANTNESDSLAHVAKFADSISGLSRLNLLLGPFCQFVGSLAAVLARYVINEPICIPPALQPRDVDFQKFSAKDRSKDSTLRFVCIDPSFVTKAESLDLLFPDKIMLGFLITGRYNDGIRLARETGNDNMAVLVALAVYLFSTSYSKTTFKLHKQFVPTKQIRDIMDSYTKPIDHILDFIFRLLTLATTGSSVLQDHPAVKTGAISLKLDMMPKIADKTLTSIILLSSLCKKSAITRWSQALCSLLHTSCYPLISIFFSQLASRDVALAGETKEPLPPIYCSQIFHGISADDTVLSLVQSRLTDVHRKIVADVVDSYISGLKCSKTLHAIVGAWKRRLQQNYFTWNRACQAASSILPEDCPIHVENPQSCLSAAWSTFHESTSSNGGSSQTATTVDILADDFSAVIASLALWHLVDTLSVSWVNYWKILENAREDAGGSEVVIAAESVIMDYLAYLLAFSLLLSNSNNNGRCLCFDVIVKLASQFTPCERVPKLLGFASALLVEMFGEELYETFVNPRLEPLMDTWKGITDKTTDQSLIYVFASELRNWRDRFRNYHKTTDSQTDKSLIVEFTSLLMSSSLLQPFVENLFNVRFDSISSISKCDSQSEMLIPENWSAVMNQILKSSGKNESNVVTPKTLVTNCLGAFTSSYPDNGSFSGQLAVGNVAALFQHMCSVIRESAVWKAGAGARTIAELERRRGDGNMAEFYQLMRPADYPQFVNEIRSICQHISTMDFTPFSLKNVEEEKKWPSVDISSSLVVHVLWMREIRPSQEQPAADLSGLQDLHEDEEENLLIGQAAGGAAAASIETGKENVSPTDEVAATVQGYWQSLERKRGRGDSEPSSSSSTTSSSLATNLSLGAGRGDLRQPPPPPLPGAAKSGLPKPTGSAPKPRKVLSSDSSQNHPPQPPPAADIASAATVTNNLVAEILQNQASSLEAIFTRFAEQQTAVISGLASLVSATYSPPPQPSPPSLPPPPPDPSSGDGDDTTSSSHRHHRNHPHHHHHHNNQAKHHKKSPSTSQSSSSTSFTSLGALPRLLTLSAPPRSFLEVNARRDGTVAVDNDVPPAMPRLLTLSEPSSFDMIDKSYVSEEGFVRVFKAATRFSSGPIGAGVALGQVQQTAAEIPPLIGVGMLRRFKARRRKAAVEEPLIPSTSILSVPTETMQAKHAAQPTVQAASNVQVIYVPQQMQMQVQQQQEVRYTASIGVNTERQRMISVGITAAVGVRSQPVGDTTDAPGIGDELVHQSHRAIRERLDEFGLNLLDEVPSSMFRNLRRQDYDPSVADIGLLNYLNRRPMPPPPAPVSSILPPKPKAVLVSSGTDTPVFDFGKDFHLPPKVEQEDATESYTKARSGLDENLRIINPESFVMLEQQLGIGETSPMATEFVSIREVANREAVQRDVRDAEAELDSLLEKARKTLAWRSDQRTIQTQTDKPFDAVAAEDSWDVPYVSGLHLVSTEAQYDPSTMTSAALREHPGVLASATLRGYSERLAAMDRAGAAVSDGMARIRQSADNLIQSSTLPTYKEKHKPQHQPTPVMESDELADYEYALSADPLTIPPILKKSVSFSESMVSSPKPEFTTKGPSRHRKPISSDAATPTTSPSTPHLDNVVLVDTGSLQPRSAAASRQQKASSSAAGAVPAKKNLMDAVRLSGSNAFRMSGVGSSTTTTTPSEMKETQRTQGGRPPLKLTSSQRKPPEVKIGQMQRRLDDASKLVAELMSEQEALKSRSTDRWTHREPSRKTKQAVTKSSRGRHNVGASHSRSRQTLRQTTLSESDRKEAAVIASHFRDVLLDTNTARSHTRPQNILPKPSPKRAAARPYGEAEEIKRKEQHLEWLLEREADLAKPPSEPSDAGDYDEGAFGDRLRQVDPTVADLLDKYSVHSGSVVSIVDWEAVDQVVAQQDDE